MPERIQRRLSKGWRMPEGAVYVGRPTRWGNHYRVVPVGRSGPFNVVFGDGAFCAQATGMEAARGIAVERFRRAVDLGWGDFPWPCEIRDELRGKDLVCWCPLDQQCHADVLLELANGEAV